MSQLAEKECVPCRGGVTPLTANEIKPLIGQLREWEVIDQHHLTKTRKFPDFATALKWVNQVGEVAERQNHHPDIHLSWGSARVDIWTHKINGLTESDFVLAAKIDQLP